MTLDEFISKYTEKTVGSGQCVALIRKYEDEVLGLTSVAVGDAHEYYDNYENSTFLKNNFNRYSISEIWGNIQKGDIIVWNTNAGGGHGHIAIWVSDNGAFNFNSFDQNWTPLKCKIESHTYSNVSGILRLKTSPGPGPSPAPTTYKKKNFKWALYANKLRNKRKE